MSKVSQYTAGTTPTGVEILYGVQSGNSRKFTITQVVSTTVPTLTASTSVVTPLVAVSGTLSSEFALTNAGLKAELSVVGNSARLQFGVETGNTWAIDNAGGTFRFLQPGTIYATLTTTAFTAPSVVTTIIDSGIAGSLSLRTNNGTVGLQILDATGGRNVTFSPSATNPVLNVTAGNLAITPAVVMASTLTVADASFHRTTTALTNGAGASVGTLTNAPAAGNPTKWLAVDDNGTTRHVPAW